MFNESIVAILFQVGALIDSFGEGLEREVSVPIMPSGQNIPINEKYLKTIRKFHEVSVFRCLKNTSVNVMYCQNTLQEFDNLKSPSEFKIY